MVFKILSEPLGGFPQRDLAIRGSLTLEGLRPWRVAGLVGPLDLLELGDLAVAVNWPPGLYPHQAARVRLRLDVSHLGRRG